MRFAQSTLAALALASAAHAQIGPGATGRDQATASPSRALPR